VISVCLSLLVATVAEDLVTPQVFRHVAYCVFVDPNFLYKLFISESQETTSSIENTRA
jgi:hypothetical protein